MRWHRVCTGWRCAVGTVGTQLGLGGGALLAHLAGGRGLGGGDNSLAHIAVGQNPLHSLAKDCGKIAGRLRWCAVGFLLVVPLRWWVEVQDENLAVGNIMQKGAMTDTDQTDLHRSEPNSCKKEKDEHSRD